MKDHEALLDLVKQYHALTDCRNVETIPVGIYTTGGAGVQPDWSAFLVRLTNLAPFLFGAAQAAFCLQESGRSHYEKGRLSFDDQDWGEFARMVNALREELKK